MNTPACRQLDDTARFRFITDWEAELSHGFATGWNCQVTDLGGILKWNFGRTPQAAIDAAAASVDYSQFSKLAICRWCETKQQVPRTFTLWQCFKCEGHNVLH